MSGWAYLGVAIGLEILATTLLKLSDGLAHKGFAAAAIGTYILCFMALAPALKLLPLGIAYAVWCGVGIVAVAIIGRVVFDQTLSGPQMLCMALVLAGYLGLQMLTPATGKSI
ncbi:DMT family transporter [Polymorphobacter sp.]|uniref:DMT family transporter n=1 Tax=Polymorphobacter sp. TaxID=1909290 RepID=UPI003F6E8EF1